MIVYNQKAYSDICKIDLVYSNVQFVQPLTQMSGIYPRKLISKVITFLILIIEREMFCFGFNIFLFKKSMTCPRFFVCYLNILHDLKRESKITKYEKSLKILNQNHELRILTAYTKYLYTNNL